MSIPARYGLRWSVQLVGESEELQALAKMLSSAPRGLRILPGESVYYLHVPEFEAMTDPRKVLERGNVVVGRLNGLGHLKFGGFRPVSTGAVDGADPPTNFSVGRIDMPSEKLRAYIDFTPNRPPAMNAVVGPIVAALPLAESWAGAADRHAPDVDDALLLLTLAVKAEDWRLLYVVYEIIEDHHKGQVATVAKALRGGTEAEAKRTVNEIKRFKATANNRRVLGIKARHGHRKHAAPSRPMTFKEARALVEELLAAWLRSLP